MVQDGSGFRVAATVTALNVLVASGFSVAGLFAPHLVLPADVQPSQGALIFAMYAAARTLPLAVLTLLAIGRRHVGGLRALGLLAGVVQFADALVGWYGHDLPKAAGPLVLGVLQMYAVTLLRRPRGDGPHFLNGAENRGSKS